MPTAIAPLFLLAMQAAAAPTTSQQIFDAATAAMDNGDCAEAVRGFRRLESSSRKSPPAVAATIKLRRGLCQIELGQTEEGEAAIRDGLAVVGALVADHRVDIRDARVVLGRVALAKFDYATAEAELKRALALSQGDERLEPLLLLARVTMFDEGPQALGYADQALGLLPQQPTDNVGKEALGNGRTLRARILLNQGRLKEGYEELKGALKLQGGLSMKVNLADIITRSDLALAALLNKDKEKAREYLAYTGAGRFEKSPFTSAVSTELPVCGGEEGLRPEDLTVVEFRLGNDGSVRGAAPIYSTGGREAAVEFARAVSTWSWTPEDAKAVPELFRYVTRVELRCSSVGERPSTLIALEQDYESWLRSNSLSSFAEAESDARTYPLVKAALGRPSGSNASLERIAPLVVLGTNIVAPEEERSASTAEAMRLASIARAPAAVRAYLSLINLQARLHGSEDPKAYPRGLRQLLADPQIAADPHGGGTLRLLLARRGYKMPAPADAPQLLAAVASDPRLAPDDPLRVAALLEQASAAARQGQLQAARQAFASTGLTEEQCALIGLSPSMKSSGASSSDFPDEAARWGFEGWVRTEFDVLANGRTVNPRPVISYPPFVFSEAAAEMTKNFRYESSFRPSGGAACTGQQQQVQFRLPD